MGELVRKATGTSTHVPATHCWRNNNTGTTRWRTTTMPCDTTTAPCASRKRSWESTTPILHSSATTLGSCTGEWVSCADCHACVHSRMRWRCRHGLVRVCIFTCAYRRFGVHVHTGHSEIALSYYQRAMSIHEHIHILNKASMWQEAHSTICNSVLHNWLTLCRKPTYTAPRLLQVMATFGWSLPYLSSSMARDFL